MGKRQNCGLFNFYEYKLPKVKVKIYLGPRFLRFTNFKVFSKSAELTESKLHIEHQWGWEIKVCSWNLGHMTKIAVMSIYSKKILKFISGTERSMTLKLDMCTEDSDCS